MTPSKKKRLRELVEYEMTVARDIGRGVYSMTLASIIERLYADILKLCEAGKPSRNARLSKPASARKAVSK
jgi:hypothetical protein